MKIFRSRPAQALAAAAALAMTSTPAMARGWHRYHDRGIDGGDVLAGVLIIGGIAAIAAAASKSNQDKREREARYPDRPYPSDQDYRDYRDYRDRSGQYGEPRYDDRSYGSGNWRGASDMSGAVSACIGEVERGRDRVDTVDAVNREADGWRVEGRVENGREFSCSVDRDSRIRRMTVDGRAVI